MPSLKHTVAQQTRKALRYPAEHMPRVRRVMELSYWELRRALNNDDVYTSQYFGDGRDPLDRMGLSGYERYDRDTSNANMSSFMLWKNFDVHKTLDVGCAAGFVVEALRELGMEAQGVDIAQYAVDHAAQGAVGHLRTGNLLEKLPFRKHSFDLVSALEILEHLPPENIPQALKELRRVTKSWLVCTIPSIGPNENGPGGWFGSKVAFEKLDEYNALPDSYEGPIPYGDLLRDTHGEPIEGHLTIASFAWWTKQFEAAGFVRCGEIERRIHPDLCRFGLTKYWNLYVLRTPGTPVPNGPVRTPAELTEREALWGLDKLEPKPEDVEAVRAVLGSVI